MVSCTGVLVILYIFNIVLFIILFVKLRKRKGTCQYESIKRKIANDEELGEIITEEHQHGGLATNSYQMDSSKLRKYATGVAMLKAASAEQATEEQTKTHRMATQKLAEIQQVLINDHATKTGLQTKTSLAAKIRGTDEEVEAARLVGASIRAKGTSDLDPELVQKIKRTASEARLRAGFST